MAVSVIDLVKFEKGFETAKAKLDPKEVREITYRIGQDWTDDDAVYFRVVLSDEAAEESRLLESASRVEETVKAETDPLGNWGFWPYFNFRSESEQRPGTPWA